jgi:hypothetical protein
MAACRHGCNTAGGYFFINTANGWNGPAKGDGMFEVGAVMAALSVTIFYFGRRKTKEKQGWHSKENGLRLQSCFIGQPDRLFSHHELVIKLNCSYENLSRRSCWHLLNSDQL